MSVLRFGVFEADLEAGELRKNGRKIRLQDQPFRVLAFLLQHPGQVVTREELREHLWGDEVFVDYNTTPICMVGRASIMTGMYGPQGPGIPIKASALCEPESSRDR
jgi:hypothetical protein